MAVKEELNNSSLKLLLDKFSIQESDFTLVPHSFNIQDFIDKKVDVTTAFISNELYHIQKSKIPYNIINPESYGIRSFSHNLFSSLDFVEKNPTLIKNFLQATKKGWEYALKNQYELSTIIYNKYSQKKSIEALLFEAKQIEKLIMPNIFPIGSINYEVMNRKLKEVIGNSQDHHDFFFNYTQSNPFSFTQEEFDYLKGIDKITMCVDPSWLPFEAIEEGKHVGMAAEYINLIEKKIGKPIQLIETSTWSESIKLAKERKCDIMSLVQETPIRNKYLNFTSSYLNFPLVLSTKDSQSFIADIKDIMNKRVGIVKGYASVELLKKRYPRIILVEFDTINDGLEAVRNSEVFAFVDSLATIGFAIQQGFIGELRVAGKLDLSLELGIGVRNDNLILLSILQKAVTSIIREDHQRIKQSWINVNYSDESHQLLQKVTLSTAVILILFVILYLVQRRYLIKLQKANQIIEEQNTQLTLLSTTDKLTQLYNRHKLEDSISEQFEYAKRFKTPLSFIMIDIDFFKRVNDNYGHIKGDYILKTFAHIVRKNIRKTDILGRWGGEEFLIISPNSSEEKSVQVAQKIQELIANYHFDDLPRQSASFGVSELHSTESTQEAINQADRALYHSKESGRNKVSKASSL